MGRRNERKRKEKKKRGQENGKGIWEDKRWESFGQEGRRKEWEGGTRGKEKKKREQENVKGLWEDKRWERD